MSELNVDKIVAAKRQLELAIRLFFQNEDSIGIHTLVSAGFRILRDIGKYKNSDVNQYLSFVIKLNMQGEFWKTFSRAANFFKHADKDPGATLEGVKEEVNDFMILFACLLYRDIESVWTPTMTAFIAWYSLIHPDFSKYLSDDPMLTKMLQSRELSSIKNKPREEQLIEGRILLQCAVSTKNI
jgi:hypothetical protein